MVIYLRRVAFVLFGLVALAACETTVDAGPGATRQARVGPGAGTSAGKTSAPANFVEPFQISAKRKTAVAVIIGNRNYRDGLPSVDFAHNDAEAIESLVRNRLGITDVISVRDASKARLNTLFGTNGNLRGELTGFIERGESDVVVFYSGHGMPGNVNKKPYLVPVDGYPDYIELGGYSLDLLKDNLRRLGARSILLLVDACFSGTSENGALVRNASALGLKAKMPKAPAGFTILTAAQGSQMARWDRQTQRGLFTSYLLKGLVGEEGRAGEADFGAFGNGDGKITLSEIRRFLDSEMTQRALRDFNQDQQAYIDGDDDFVLANYNLDWKREREAKELATKKERALWASATKSEDELLFRSYLRKYPTGAFVQEARQLLSLIENKKLFEQKIERLKKNTPIPLPPQL